MWRAILGESRPEELPLLDCSGIRQSALKTGCPRQLICVLPETGLKKSQFKGAVYFLKFEDIFRV
jgi:hypothetical protein